ncbi:hypothetical protein GCM10028801_20340 [Nocardioides maradonensis]
MEGTRRWVGDTSIGWRILLTAELGSSVDRVALAALQRRLTEPDPRPVRVEDVDGAVVISAHHSAADGLGLLELLERAGHGPARSAARGVGAQEGGSLGAGIRQRLVEALLRPPASPVPPVRTRSAGDVLVTTEVAGPVTPAALVYAGARAARDWQAARGARADHVAIAVGASRGARPPGADPADDSVLLRLRDVELLDRDGVAAALRAAGPEVSPGAAATSWLAGAALGLGLRALRSRLGSTLLVSHLGEVTAPDVERLSFHPVTAGGSGLSLGAVGHRGRTTLTLRARASRWDDDGLEHMLEAVVQRL